MKNFLKENWFKLALAIAFIVLVIFYPSQKNQSVSKKPFDTGQYKWQDENGAEKYKNVVWNKIKENRLSGLTSVGDVVAEREIACRWSDGPCYSLISKNDEYLRVEGGLARRYYFLTIAKNGELQTLKSLEELKKFFAPVDSEVEAVSFIGVTERDLKKNENDVLVGETAVSDDGYLVKVVKNNTFGCGRHDPQSIIFKVTKDGEITVVAIEVLPSHPRTRNFSYTCVD